MSPERPKFHKSRKDASQHSRRAEAPASPKLKGQQDKSASMVDPHDRYTRLRNSNFMNEKWVEREIKQLQAELGEEIEFSPPLKPYKPRSRR